MRGGSIGMSHQQRYRFNTDEHCNKRIASGWDSASSIQNHKSILFMAMEEEN